MTISNKKSFLLKTALLALLCLCFGAASSNGCVVDDEEYYKIILMGISDKALVGQQAFSGFYIIDGDIYTIDAGDIVSLGGGTYYSYTKPLGSFTNLRFYATADECINQLSAFFYRDDDILEEKTSTRSTDSSNNTTLANISLSYTTSESN